MPKLRKRWGEQEERLGVVRRRYFSSSPFQQIHASYPHGLALLSSPLPTGVGPLQSSIFFFSRFFLSLTRTRSISLFIFS